MSECGAIVNITTDTTSFKLPEANAARMLEYSGPSRPGRGPDTDNDDSGWDNFGDGDGGPTD